MSKEILSVNNGQRQWQSSRSIITTIIRTKTSRKFSKKAKAAISRLGLDDFLDINFQPCLIVELVKSDLRTNLRIAYCNPALLEHSGLLKGFSEELNPDETITLTKSQSDLANWILAEKTDLVAGSSYLFKDYLWSNCCTIEGRYL